MKAVEINKQKIKRIYSVSSYWILLFFVAICLFNLTGCSDSDIENNNLNSTTTTESWIVNSLTEISSYQSSSPSSEATLAMVKGEYEHFQLVLQVPQDITFSIERLNKSEGLEINYRAFATFEGHEDVLVPCNGVVKTSGKVAKLWITYYAKPNAAAGEYRETLVFSNGNQKYYIWVNISIHDITLPETPSIVSAFGIYSTNLKTQNSTPSENERKYKEVTDLLLNYRISPFANLMPVASSPYSWDDPRTIPYISDKRFSRISIPYFSMTDVQLQTMLNTYRQNGLLAKSYFYIKDEPRTMAEYDQIKTNSARVKKIAPDAKILATIVGIPEGGSPDIDGFLTNFDHLRGSVQIFCTGYYALKNKEAYSEKCRAKLQPGEEWWTYACMADQPGLSYISTPIENRVVLWRCWKEQNTGFLYWSVNGFASTEPLASQSNLPQGDGILVYPGESFGVGTPVVSVRLERWRDGAEDYELLSMMEKKKGREATLALLWSVYHSPTYRGFTSNPKDIEVFKTKLIQQIKL